MVGAKGWEVQFGPDSSYDMHGARAAEINNAFKGRGDGTDADRLAFDAASLEECMERCIHNDHCNSFTYDPDHSPMLINKSVRNNLPNCLLAKKEQPADLVKLQEEENYEYNDGYWWYSNPDAKNLVSGIRCSFDNLIDPPKPADYVYTKGTFKHLIDILHQPNNLMQLKNDITKTLLRFECFRIIFEQFVRN